MSINQKVKEYEQKLRQEDLSESDIEFLVGVYREHLKANSGDASSNDVKRYLDFAHDSLKTGLCREDITLAIDTFEKYRKT